MGKSTRDLIAGLQRNRRFMGTCPVCNEEFRLADAILFAFDDEPPEVAIAAINGIRSRIKQRKDDLSKRRMRITTGAQRTSHAVNLGKIVEKIVPSFATFAYNIGDCRALFEPIDFIVFSGLTKAGVVDALVVVDVKSGKARLSVEQKDIRDAVKSGSVSFSVIASKGEQSEV